MEGSVAYNLGMSRAVVKLVLASRSPRRMALLREAGFAFEALTPRFDDPADPGANGQVVSPEALAQELALAKGRSVAEVVERGSVVLAADTIVVRADGAETALLGQPRSAEEARTMLRSLVNASHVVITGVALVQAGGERNETFSDKAVVHLGAVDGAALERYVESEAWRGKAGGYNLLELEDQWPFRVEGDRTTVAGLPMVKVVQRLTAWGIVPVREPHAR